MLVIVRDFNLHSQLVRHSSYVEEIYSEGKTKESIRFWRLAFTSKGEEIYDIKNVSPQNVVTWTYFVRLSAAPTLMKYLFHLHI